MVPMKMTRTFAAAAAAALSLSACSTSMQSDSGRTDSATATGAKELSVIAEVYPLAWIAQQVGGEQVNVQQLVPSGASPHDLELSAQQVEKIGNAQLVLYVKSLASAVDKAVETGKPGGSIDLAQLLPTRPGVPHEHHDHHGHHEEADHDHHEEAEHDEAGHDHHEEADHKHHEEADHDEAGHDHHEEADHEHHDEAEHEHAAGGIDPHLWLDVSQMPKVVQATVQALSKADPAHKTEYQKRGQEVSTKLQNIAAEYETGLKNCQVHTLVTTHPAFGYITDRYHLTQVGISGIDEDTEPSPARLKEIAELTKNSGATTIFFADTSNPKIAQVLAGDLGLKTQVIYTMASTPQGKDYLQMQKDNLQALRSGLGCQ